MSEKHLVNGFGGESFGAAMHGGGAGGQPAFAGGGGAKDPWEVSDGQGLPQLGLVSLISDQLMQQIEASRD